MKQLKIQQQITVREGPALEKYLNDISKSHPLKAEEEVELAIKIRAGDVHALEKMVTSNLRFVVSVAKQYQNKGLALADLINEGNMGLIKAATKFDETRGFKFISYAVWWIRQSIMAALVENARVIRLPLNKIDSYHKINHALTEFLQKNQREPSTYELAEMTELSETQVRALLKMNSKPVSMDAPLGSNDDAGRILDVVPDLVEAHPDERLAEQSLAKEVRMALSSLNDRENQVLSMYYGLDGSNYTSLEDIGSQLGLTRERVRQIKERAIRRLRRNRFGKELQNYLG